MILRAVTRKRILSLPYAREMTNWITNINNVAFYNKLNKKKHYDLKIARLKGNASGKRCFIVGNGPSLSLDQLLMIKDEDCFGANRIFKIFDQTEWRPKYYIVQDKYDDAKEIYDCLGVPYLFVSDFYWREHDMGNPNAICYHIKRNLKQSDNILFSANVAEFIQAASTVTYTIIQLAVFMGYSEIYLIGMDHIYANVTNDKGEIIQRNNVKNHTFEDKNPNEVVANLDYMELAYQTARKYCDEHGILIKNATLGGALEIFERIDFWKLFNNR